MLEQRSTFEGIEARCIMADMLKEDKVATSRYETHEGTSERAPYNVIMTNHRSATAVGHGVNTALGTESPSSQYLLRDESLRHGNAMWSLQYSDSKVQMSFMPITIVGIRPFAAST